MANAKAVSPFNNKGQALIETTIVASFFIFFFSGLMALGFWIFIRWGAQVAVYEYLICRNSITERFHHPSCRQAFESGLKKRSFDLLKTKYDDSDNRHLLQTRLQMQGPFHIRWTIKDSIKLPLVPIGQ